MNNKEKIYIRLNNPIYPSLGNIEFGIKRRYYDKFGNPPIRLYNFILIPSKYSNIKSTHIVLLPFIITGNRGKDRNLIWTAIPYYASTTDKDVHIIKKIPKGTKLEIQSQHF